MGANTVHETSNWKCDKASASAASSFPMIASEMIYAYVVAGNTAPYCVPLPATAGASLTSSVWMHIGYALKKYEQSLWAAYYSSVPYTSMSIYSAADSFYLWDYA